MSRPVSQLRRVLQPTRQILAPFRPQVTQTRKVLRPSSSAMSSIPTFDFKEREPTPEEKGLIDDVLLLYQLQPISRAYARYSPEATFHDPIGIANGLNSVKAQFNSMPKIFSSSETKGLKVLDNPAVTPPSVQFSLSQLYKLKLPPTEKLVNSLITLHVDPSTNLITQHDEEWDGKPNSTSDDGFFGKINEMRKKATASVIEMGSDTRPVDQQK